MLGVGGVCVCLGVGGGLIAMSCLLYCEFERFGENFVFTNSVRRHICDVKICDYGMICLL